MWVIIHFLNVVFIPLFSMLIEKRYDIEVKELGKRIKKIRESNNWTQLDIEIRTGISRSDISKIENGLKNIEFFTLVKIADALKVQTVDLFKTEKK
jgi:HTH-type transcriptional regulator, competence development regulator